MKKVISLLLCLTLCLSVPGQGVFAEWKRDSGDRAVAFTIVTDIGPQIFATRHYYRLTETYETQGTAAGGYIKFTEHQTASWCTGWSGANFGSIEVYNPNTVHFYDNLGNAVGSAGTVRDTDMIWDPAWIGYECATGQEIVTITKTSVTAKATFFVFCPESVYGYSGYEASVNCNNY